METTSRMVLIPGEGVLVLNAGHSGPASKPDYLMSRRILLPLSFKVLGA